MILFTLQNGTCLLYLFRKHQNYILKYKKGMFSAKPKFHQAVQKTDPRDVVAQSAYIYLEYRSVCPLVRIGTPSPADECVPPEPKRGGTHSSGGEGVGVTIWTTGERL